MTLCSSTSHLRGKFFTAASSSNCQRIHQCPKQSVFPHFLTDQDWVATIPNAKLMIIVSLKRLQKSSKKSHPRVTCSVFGQEGFVIPSLSLVQETEHVMITLLGKQCGCVCVYAMYVTQICVQYLRFYLQQIQQSIGEDLKELKDYKMNSTLVPKS